MAVLYSASMRTISETWDFFLKMFLTQGRGMSACPQMLEHGVQLPRSPWEPPHVGAEMSPLC